MSVDSKRNDASILKSGRNCWTADASVDASGVLIDGRDYYRAFYRAVQQTTRYIFIAGWKFNSDVRLLRGADAEEAGQEARLLPFLKAIVKNNPDLRICMLAWDYSVIYAWEWEWDLESKFSDAEGRLQFRFDNHHAIGASHHQKFVVIDGRVAFVGGFDFNGDDWDDREHRPDHPDRGDSGKHHGPYHDVQACLVGSAAEELARYFQTRWNAAGDPMIELPAPQSLGPVDVGIPVHAERAALSLNQPMTLADGHSILQIRQLYLDAIAAARSLIYVENQYVTADAIADALERRMRDKSLPLLEIVVVQPRQLPGWVEAATLEPLRLRLLDMLSGVAQETGHHLGFYYTATQREDGVEVATLIHSKVLIVDDRFLTVGSANASNRSQGLDTELNVSWEARHDDDALMESIRNVRVDLLSEHCGFRADRNVAQRLGRIRGLVHLLDELVSAPLSRLRHLTREIVVQDRDWLTGLERLGFSLDPAQPIVEGPL